MKGVIIAMLVVLLALVSTFFMAAYLDGKDHLKQAEHWKSEYEHCVDQHGAIIADGLRISQQLRECQTDMSNCVWGLNRQLAELYPMMVYGTNMPHK